jgi:hypothetical protein
MQRCERTFVTSYIHFMSFWFVFVFGLVSVSVSQTLLVNPFWLRKITTDPQSFAHVNVECPVDRYPKLKSDISELIIDIF